MSESLMSRITRLISGTVYDSADALEARMPETVMRESIREIDRTVDDVRQQLAATRREQQVARRRISLTKERIEKLGHKIATAFDAKRDDLAEAAVGRQLDLESQIPVLEKSAGKAGDKAVELESYIAALQGRKAEMEAELESFSEMKKDLSGVATDGDLGGQTCAHEGRAEKARGAFDRVIKNATGVGGFTVADRDTSAKMIELEALQRKERIAERLAQARNEHRA